MNATEQGSISGIVVCLTMSLMSVVALSLEGGKVVQTYGELATLCASTARLGGQQITGIRDGQPHIDERRARNSMIEFLKAHGEVGEFRIGSTDISVTLRRKIKMTFFQLLGVSAKTVEVTRTITVVKG